jgi:hypothetical protein
MGCKKFLFIATLGLSLLTMGCASLSTGGSAVRQFSGNPLPECSYLGNVIGSGLSGAGSAAYDPATRDLRNKTAELGGNFVRISSFGGAFVKDIEGEAYLCPTDTQIVVREPTPDEQMAHEMKRQNDIAERQQRANAMKDMFKPQPMPYQIPVRKSTTTNCYPGLAGSIHCTSN